MALFDLNRSNDTPIATLQVASITPLNWHKFPPAIQPPNTAVAGTDPNLVVTITGTGFTPWSTVLSGNFPIPVRYISPTKLEILQKPKASVAGTVQVVVIDHGVKSAPSNFVFT
jgi:hypothetical protein